MGLIGPPLYEWISHNLFVFLLIAGTIAVMGYFLYYAVKKKGWYRKS